MHNVRIMMTERWKDLDNKFLHLRSSYLKQVVAFLLLYLRQ